MNGSVMVLFIGGPIHGQSRMVSGRYVEIPYTTYRYTVVGVVTADGDNHAPQVRYVAVCQ